MVQAAGHIGERIPIHIGPAKVILANKSDAEIERYLSKVEIEPFTNATVSDKDLLREQLRRIRDQGHCIDHEEFEDGCHAYSAPLFDLTGSPVAALVMAVPSVRLTPKREAQVIQLTSSAARQLSAQMGYQG